MNKNQWRHRLGLKMAGIPAVLASFVLVLDFFITQNNHHYLSGQPPINLILLFTTHFITGTLTIVLARHIILFYPASISSGLWIIPGTSPSRGSREPNVQWLIRNHRKKGLLLPGF
jgi:hypothetical protein